MCQVVLLCRRASQRVVVAANCVTSRGPGTAFEFSLALIEQLLGAEQMSAVAGPMVMYSHQEPVPIA
jgi:transcriptional regulator GlxA family with amidase domain